MQTTPRLLISDAVEMLHRHFYPDEALYDASRLLVVAMYSLYEHFMGYARYQTAHLAPLDMHTLPNGQCTPVGDITIVRADGTPMEAFMVKHNEPITIQMVQFVIDEIRSLPVSRCYLLTTYEPTEVDHEANLFLIDRFYRQHKIEIIIDSFLTTLKYSLRLLRDPDDFIQQYSVNLRFEFQQRSDIKQEHMVAWQQILSEIE